MNVLSQSEIDALLRSMQTGQGSAPQQEHEAVRKYDFRTANRFTKEHIRTVGAVFKSFGHLLSNYLVGLLRASCDVEILSREEMSFMEFNNSVPSPSIVSVISVAPMGGMIIFNISKDLAFTVVSRVLGGAESVMSDNRQFTDIELILMERIVCQMLGCFDEAWSKYITVTSLLERTETSMQFAQIADNNEAVLVITMSVQLGQEQSVISFCMPRQTMAPILKKLNIHTRVNAAASPGKARPGEMAELLGKTGVELSARFNSTEARTDDILRLQVGDVIRLDHGISEPLTVLVQREPKYRASYGTLRQRYAIKIQEVIKGDDTNGSHTV